VPTPGVELKLVPNEGKLEARLRGPHITPGYWRQDELTRDAFDEEGFYKIGDALKFVDPSDPGKGLLFDGRIAEDFKLSTGTWVSVGPLRARFIDHFAPYVRDAVFGGADRDFIAALVFPDLEACRKLGDSGADATASDIVNAPGVRQKFSELLRKLAALSQGSSTRVERAILMADLPSMDKGEMTDKGSINQRAVLRNRAALVDELYGEPLSSQVIAVGENR
jgi:feruloyl-CoA synthase